MNDDRMLRTVRLTGGADRTYTLRMWSTNRVDRRGQTRIAYNLTQDGDVAPIFEGEDFCASPMHADDSDESVAALLGFLTLRPGDTDPDYFADYTARQRQWCDEDAEMIGCDVSGFESGDAAVEEGEDWRPWTNLDGWEGED